MESPEACVSEIEDSGIKKVEEMGLEKVLCPHSLHSGHRGSLRLKLPK